jgi:hypothetical protein
MSKYQWEAGTIIIPSKDWTSFKRTLRESHNRLQSLRFELATSLSAELKTLGRGKRNFDFERAAEEVFTSLVRGARFAPLSEEFADIERAVFPKPQGAQAGKLPKPLVPKKKDFPLATSRTNSFHFAEASITLTDKGRKFHWRVSENNRSCERAREHPMAQAAFHALGRIKWTRATGGKITGNDEYNREGKDEGEGSNYVVEGFGPLGEEEWQKLRRSIQKRQAARARI